VVSLPLREGPGERQCPLPENVFSFRGKKIHFVAFWMQLYAV